MKTFRLRCLLSGWQRIIEDVAKFNLTVLTYSYDHQFPAIDWRRSLRLILLLVVLFVTLIRGLLEFSHLKITAKSLGFLDVDSLPLFPLFHSFSFSPSPSPANYTYTILCIATLYTHFTATCRKYSTSALYTVRSLQLTLSPETR